MSAQTFTIEDLKRILRSAAGADDLAETGGDVLDGDIIDTSFEALGYESLALLETGSRIEREYGISLDDDVLAEAPTPRALINTVNEHLSAAA